MKQSYFQIFILLLMACYLSACFPDQNDESASSYVKVEIADRVFKIPKGYFDGAQPTGKNTESVVLEYSLPDFKMAQFALDMLKGWPGAMRPATDAST